MSTGPSVKDVAALAQVSVGTVSNVLNRPDQVTPDKRKRVQAAIAQLGFVRNESARSLRSGSSRSLGMLVLDVRNPFFTDVALGAEDVAEDHKYSFILANSSEDARREQTYLDLFEEQRVQGILITPFGDVLQRLEAMRARGIPSVLVDRLAGSEDFCSVSVDDEAGGRTAMEHLIASGAERPAFVGGPFTLQQVADRHAGALAAAEAAGVALQVFETPNLKFERGRQIGDIIGDLRQSRRPDAVFAANDQLALGLLQSFTAKGIRVPDEIALIGFDDIDFASQSSIPLSSIRQPRQLIGERAAQLLFDEIENPGGHGHQQIVFTPELVVRASSRQG
ncbi:LacI family DNA-binding transcriptional regulator [Arthrobacter sp. ISL-72]|uniref:LacI family DNA-binding transcriptional regulator n=1 Tax=Arthrobacter sp. ISL-72 TaxID=2819114 RepID=UPI001BEB1516|nr:LacI family DNA-binding transcriptional regulator [Arthrobacter sp. ISL-72]MBT2597084.1 LacI family DNA-binding transcriptional regulator [Arthrobacter sp. ISL-72]